LPLDIAVVVGAAVLGTYELRSGSHGFGIAMLSLSGLFALMLVVAFAFIPRIGFRREPKFRDDYALTFSPQGVHFRTAHIDSHLQWSMYTSALVDAHSFVLYYGSQHFTVIPKRVFQDVVQRETFERLLTENVAKVIHKAK
jgi:hypothetical protein